MSILSFWLNNIHQNFIIQMELVKGPITCCRKFFGGKNTFGLQTNINQNLVLVNAHDHAIDYIAAFDIDRSGGCRQQRFHLVVVDHLLGVVVLALMVVFFEHRLYPSALKICRWHRRKVAVLLHLHGNNAPFDTRFFLSFSVSLALLLCTVKCSTISFVSMPQSDG